MPQKFLTSKEMAEILGVTENSLWRWRVAQEGPPFIKVGKLVRYYPLSKRENEL